MQSTGSREGISGKSSSSGSYSIGGSNPNVTESNDKSVIDKIKELPEKIEKKEIKQKEDKKLSEKKEQLVPKMVVRIYLNITYLGNF